MMTTNFSVNHESPGRLSAFCGVSAECSDPGINSKRHIQGEVITADGVRIVRAINIPSATFQNRSKMRKKRASTMLAIASQPHAISTPSRQPHWHGPNELIVLNTAQPWQVQVARPYLSTVITVEDELLHQILPKGDHFLKGQLHRAFRLESVMCGLMESTWLLAKAGHFDVAAPRILRSLIDTIWLASMPAGADQQTGPYSGTLEIRRNQVKAYIEKHYSRSDLSVELIARDMGMSSRYIRRVFTEAGSSPSRYLHDFRLDMCAGHLKDPANDSKSVTELALACGFNSPPHFSTEFKERFGLSPKEFRSSRNSNNGLPC